MTKKLRIGLIFGGRSGEHEISLLSARSILAALDPEKYTITQIGITHDGSWLVGENVLDAMSQENYGSLTPGALLADPSHKDLYAIHSGQSGMMLEALTELDLAYPVLHGTFGEDGTIQGLFEMANLAYVGSGVVGSAVGMDKGIFKDVMRANGIPVPESVLILRSEIERDLNQAIAKAEEVANYPLFVKPCNLGSSVGVTKCHRRSDLLEGLQDAARYDRRILVERAINAHEVECSVLGNENPQASVPGEVIPSREFYSYEAKYLDGTSGLLIPAPIPDTVKQEIQSLAIRAFVATDCAGLARVDFLVDKQTSQVYLMEINTLPGFTNISMYPKLWVASGIPYSELVDRLIALALERRSERDRTEWRFRRDA
jgi:D-alanine-D-alanine ligase